MFEKSNKTVNILIIVIGVLSTLLIGILFFSNMRQNELNEELNRTVQQKLTLLANKPLPKMECPKVECPKMECPKMECPKQPELKCPEVKVPSCPPCPTMDLSSMKQECPKCPDCPSCPTVSPPESVQKPRECPPPKECPAPRICPQPQACPPPRRCPPVRIVQKPCPRDKERFPAINEIMAKQSDVNQNVNSGNYFPFNELKGMCPVKSSATLSTLSYASLKRGDQVEEEIEEESNVGQQLVPRGIQMEEQPDVTEGPLLTADFTGNNQDVPEEPVVEEPVVEEPVVEEPVMEEPVMEEPVVEETIDALP